ncbi:coordinator of PRMT5 and differentiation stimulator [Artibeus jamaicensis]|uniref:coordinator of PRMT5 and differentiation stimulator n=1 Tax=Artibeus jamaicensis TaxID=9417 RepID=UPI00235A503E|nr:coordinator of PRMT5 and differentiation stimulator [Artibeus jamaicensis]
MDPQTSRAVALGAAEPPRGPSLPSAREAPPSPEAGFGPDDYCSQERETKKATDRLEELGNWIFIAPEETFYPEASGAQSIPNDSPAGGEGPPSEEEGFAVGDEDSDGELSAWELSERTPRCLPTERAAELLHEDWDSELKADQGNPYDADDIQGCVSQEAKPWVCCAPQGEMLYDPSWHHPPPLIPHYSKMVFETGQFDDAED